jgi:DNA polymerase V
MSSGGRRENAGRPANSGKFSEPTKPTRLPERFVDSINQLDEDDRSRLVSYLEAFFIPRLMPLGAREMVTRDQLPKPQLLRRYPSVAATIGVTSTLSDTINMDDSIDLHHLLIPNPEECFGVPVKGDSMNQAGIHDGDLLIVQRLKDSWTQLTSGTIVVAFVDNNETVKRFIKTGEQYSLEPDSDNESHQPIQLTNKIDVWIVGVVLHSIHPIHRSSRF